MYLVTDRQMRQIEAAANERGHTYAELMREAGAAVARAVASASPADRPAEVMVLVGPGNNGGDGLVAADLLLEAGHVLRLCILQRSPDEAMLDAFSRRHPSVPQLRTDAPEAPALFRAWLAETDVLVDAWLGTGTHRPFDGTAAALLDLARGRIAVVAVDLPSGLDADTGSVDAHTLPADVTVTFGAPKVGHFTLPGAAYVGRLIVEDIGLGPELEAGAEAPDWATVATATDIARKLPARPPGAHKGSFGKALVVAGSTAYTGAAYLAAEAAYRAGCGLVTVALPRAIHAVVAGLVPEATFLALPDEDGVLVPDGVAAIRAIWSGYDALLVGPGLTVRPPAEGFMAALVQALAIDAGGPVELNGEAGNRSAMEDGGKAADSADPSPLHHFPRIVVDADGLNLLARSVDGPEGLPGGGVLTPHPGEMGRLAGLSVADVNADRLDLARRMAARWGQVVVLKGAYTVVAAPDGRASVNPFDVPALATAGTGDVLAGTVTGLLAQGLTPFDAAIVATYVHARAGQLAAASTGGRGVIARSVLARLGEAMAELAAGSGDGGSVR